MAKEKKELIVGVNGDLSDNFTTGQKAVLGLQNTLAMCGVILVPILCGLDVSVTLFCAGIGTIIYQFIDKKMVPAFLGGSFAIIAGVSTVVGEMGIPYAQGGILGMAVFYLLFALLLKVLGKECEFVEGVEKGYVETIGSPEYACYLNDYMAILQGMLT